MSDLQVGWAQATIEELTIPIEQIVPLSDVTFTYIDIGSVDRQTKRVVSPQVLLGKDAPSRARKLLRQGDTLVSMTRPNLNAVALVGAEHDGQIASTGFDVLRSPGLDPRWIAYLVRTSDFVAAMSDLVQGALYPAVSSKNVRAFVAPVAPRNEQIRIADKLDAVLLRVDACREHLDRIPVILKRFRQSVLAAATSERLTEDWRETRPNYDRWATVQLRDVAHSFSYGSSAKSAKVGAIPVLRMGNIQNGLLDWTDLVFTSEADEIEKYRLVDGDVLFNRTNSAELVGKSAVFKGERKAVYAGYLIRVRCSSKLLPDYLNYCLGSPAGRDYCWQVKSDGVSQSNINAKKLAAFEFSLPAIQEQVEIVRRVETLFAIADCLEARYTTARAQVKSLTQAILAKAFRGELVHQYPNEESASELLKHLAAERIKNAHAPAQGRNNRRAIPVKPKIIIPVIEALRTAPKGLSTQALFMEAGYPAEAGTDLVERFFLDVRNELSSKRIEKIRKGNDDYFVIAS